MQYISFHKSIKSASKVILSLYKKRGREALPQALSDSSSSEACFHPLCNKNDLNSCNTQEDEMHILPPIQQESEVLFGLPNFDTMNFPHDDSNKADFFSKNFLLSSESSFPGTHARYHSQPPSLSTSISTESISFKSYQSSSGNQPEIDRISAREKQFDTAFQQISKDVFENDEPQQGSKIFLKELKPQNGVEDLRYLVPSSSQQRNVEIEIEKLLKIRDGRICKEESKPFPKLKSISEEESFRTVWDSNSRARKYTSCQSGILPSVFEDDSEEDEELNFKNILPRRLRRTKSSANHFRKELTPSQSSLLSSLTRSNSRRSTLM